MTRPIKEGLRRTSLLLFGALGFITLGACSNQEEGNRPGEALSAVGEHAS